MVVKSLIIVIYLQLNEVASNIPGTSSTNQTQIHLYSKYLLKILVIYQILNL